MTEKSGQLNEAIEVLKTYMEVRRNAFPQNAPDVIREAIDTVLAAFPQSRQMTAEEYIRETYGETWLHYEWSAGDVIDALDGFANHRIEEEERLFRERIESDAELWGRVGAKPPRLSNSTEPIPKED